MIKNFSFILIITFLFISCAGLDHLISDEPEEQPSEANVIQSDEDNPENPTLDESPIEENVELGMNNDELEMTNDELEDSVELLMMNDELEESEELIESDDTKEKIAELSDKVDALTEMVAQLLLRQFPPQILEEPVQPPSVTTPPPAIAVQPISPPVITQPPVQTPPAPIQPVPLTEDIIETEEDETEESVRAVYVPELQSAPATRIESLTQMGAIPPDNEINFSRIVRATAGQLLEIPFRGNGWVFLGELASRRGIVYNSRRNDPEGLSFIFSLDEPGVYVLKFFRQDFIRDFILNDYVQVVVGEAPSVATGWFNPAFDRGRVIAQPRWPSALEEARIRSGSHPAPDPVVSGGFVHNVPATTQTTQPQTTQPQTTQPQTTQPQITQPQTTPVPTVTPTSQTAAQQPAAPAPEISEEHVTEKEPQPEVRSRIPGTEGLSGDMIIQRAQSSFDGGNAAAAIALLDQYMNDFPGGSDEVYWMYGQFYEANTSARNILLSREYYRRLMNEYPQSRRFNDARRRVAYLERFYINIQ